MSNIPAAIDDPKYPNQLGEDSPASSDTSAGEQTLVGDSSTAEKSKVVRRRSISVIEPPARANRLAPLASRVEEHDDEEGPSPRMIRVPTFNNRNIYYSSGGPGSALRKYASEGTRAANTRFAADDPRARRGLPGLFSLVSHEHFHADEVGYRGSMYQEEPEEGDEEAANGEKKKEKDEKDPNLIGMHARLVL